jgi:S-adenosylmethionine/arginine decarboxylase-like enzyme
VILDGRLKNRTWSAEDASLFCGYLAGWAQMKVISGPYGYDLGNGKVKGIAIIAESHVICEFDTVKGGANIDIFSCKRVPAVAVNRAMRVLSSWRLQLIHRTELP